MLYNPVPCPRWGIPCGCNCGTSDWLSRQPEHVQGVGRVYQQAYVDTYSKVAHAKLYTTKTPISAADFLNDRVLLFYEDHDLPVQRILTDRGTEYCGRADKHDFSSSWQSITARQCVFTWTRGDIDHTKTKVKSPQTNGNS